MVHNVLNPFAFAVLFLVLSCGPTYQDCTVRCELSIGCPGNLTCVAGFCSSGATACSQDGGADTPADVVELDVPQSGGIDGGHDLVDVVENDADAVESDAAMDAGDTGDDAPASDLVDARALTNSAADVAAYSIQPAFPNNFLADVTGEGLGDLVHLLADQNSIAVQYPVGAKFSDMEIWSRGFAGRRGTFFADVTGDRAADAIAVDDESIRVKVSTTRAFGAEQRWRSQVTPGTRGTFFADVTGDGKADLITVNDGSIEVFPSSGQAFSSPQTWSSQPSHGSLGTFFGDVDGDGRADVVAFGPHSIEVRRSAADAFLPAERWSSDTRYGHLGTELVDITGDRRADLVMVNDFGVSAQVSTGTAFGAATKWTPGPAYGEKGTYFGDLNGDGRADLLGVGSYYIGAVFSTGAAFERYEHWSDGPNYGTLITCPDPNPGYRIYHCFVVHGVSTCRGDASADAPPGGADANTCDASP